MGAATPQRPSLFEAFLVVFNFSLSGGLCSSGFGCPPPRPSLSPSKGSQEPCVLIIPSFFDSAFTSVEILMPKLSWILLACGGSRLGCDSKDSFPPSTEGKASLTGRERSSSIMEGKRSSIAAAKAGVYSLNQAVNNCANAPCVPPQPSSHQGTVFFLRRRCRQSELGHVNLHNVVW